MKEFTQNKRHIKCISNMTDVTKSSEIKKKNLLENENETFHHHSYFFSDT